MEFVTLHNTALLGIGIFSGFMSGMFGIGGGSVRIPLLNVSGLSLLTSFGINLIVIPFSSFIGAVTHRKNFDKHLALYMIIGGIPASVLAAYFAGLIPTLVLAIIFVVIAIITVGGIYFNKIAPVLAAKITAGPKTVISGSFIVTMLTGLRGGSGGSLYPPLLRLMNINIHKAISVSLFATIFTAIFGVMIYWGRGDIPFVPAVIVIAGSIIGSRTGSLASLKTKPAWLEFLLSALVMVLALLVIIKAL